MNRAALIRRLDAAAARLVGALPWLLVGTLVVVGAWRAADWGWRLAPDPAAGGRQPTASDSAQAAALRGWFGTAAEAEAVAAAVVASPTAASVVSAAPANDVRLLGVIAGGRRPLAMLEIARTPYEVQPGETFADGLVLRQVGREHVIVERQGRSFRIDLPTAPGAGGSTSAAAPAGVPQPSPKRSSRP
jgi:type II secretory pathway component PulC